MPIAPVNGQQLFYRDTGGEGPVLVFSHGLLMDHEMFEPQLEAFGLICRCIAWDERAHGQTAGDDVAPFSYYDSAGDLVALLDYLGIERAVLVGMSQGGYLSLRCALTHPQRVEALVLIDTQARVEEPAKLAGYEQMLDVWTRQGLPDSIADDIADIILGPAWHGAEQWKAKWRGWQSHNLKQAFRTLIDRDDISRDIARIEVPALVIHGEADQAITLDRAEDMAGHLRHAEMVTVPEAGHAPNLTHPEPVNAAISRFLKRLGYI
ncbi:alpha/beta fold hydrolase [Salinisphaera sp. SWV1]|uniref:alpha/beta fold hydrolase n=1 Tax=Salinisphaera sp. SWV1 TaxID=3454139 RepID=UPI003F843C13